MNNPLPPDSHNPLHPPVYPTLVFLFENTAELIDFVEQKSPDKFEYARYGNPTRRALEYKLANYEGSEDAVVCASGMSACTMPLLALLQKDDHIIFTSNSYLKTRFFIEKTLPTFGIHSTIVDHNIEAIEAAIRPETKIIFTEMPSNPLFRVIDLEGLTTLCKSRDIISMIDSTLASPINLKPIEFGVDLVIHSMTKYFAGQNDLIAGGIAGKKNLVAKVRDRIGELGAILPANECYRLFVAMKTMPLRVKTQNESAFALAHWLEKHKNIRKVHYPLLGSHIDSANAKKYLKGGGCLITIEIDGNFDQMRKFCDSTQIFKLGPSFGSPNSLIDPPVIMSHWDVAPEERQRMGITDSMVRLSIGLEDINDLKADIDQSLQKAFQ